VCFWVLDHQQIAWLRQQATDNDWEHIRKTEADVRCTMSSPADKADARLSAEPEGRHARLTQIFDVEPRAGRNPLDPCLSLRFDRGRSRLVDAQMGSDRIVSMAEQLMYRVFAASSERAFLDRKARSEVKQSRRKAISANVCKPPPRSVDRSTRVKRQKVGIV
jgi:hypothetical protein